MTEQQKSAKSPKKIGIVTNILSKALKLWLRSQTSHVSQLEVEMKASDRQLLSGSIPSVSIFASDAIYQGLHITHVRLIAENIRVNIGSVLKGQPLKLLETVPVMGELIVREEDLEASLSSKLLSTALNDVLNKLLPEHSQKSKSISWQKISLDYQKLILRAIVAPESDAKPIDIVVFLKLLGTNELQLAPIEVTSNTESLLEGASQQYINMGNDVDIQELTLIPGKLLCRGGINVNP